MTAAQLRGFNTGPALVAYLSQPDASPSVCDLNAAGSHLVSLDDDTSKSLAQALRDGRIAPALWARCTTALLRSAPREGAVTLADQMLSVQSDLLTDRHVETDAGLQARLSTLSGVYLERPTHVAAHPRAIEVSAADVRKAIARKRLGPIASRYGNEFLAGLELERGRWQGRPADVAFLNGLFEARDEKVLRRSSERLPDAALRREARLRVIRLHVESSPLAQVREDPAVIERLMATGTNAVSAAEHPPVAGALITDRMPVRRVVVEQNSRQQTARLFGSGPDRPSVSVLPDFSLRGVLQVQLAGLSQAITVCGPAEDLDPTPCLSPADLKLESPFVHVDGTGTLRFIEQMKEVDAARLARGGARLTVPISVAGRQVAALEWELSFNRPDDLVFEAKTKSETGPNLSVSVDQDDSRRLIYSVTDEGRTQMAVVEWPDARSFRVMSRGGPGWDGSSGMDGMDGTSGMAGMSASCPSFSARNGESGGCGTPGGPGGDGQSGGPGGSIQVNIACSPSACGEIQNLVRATIQSIGGAGGHGGSGGRGGRGGEGGPGGRDATCSDSEGHTIWLPSGLAGSRGSDGVDGWSGSDGLPGRPGEVIIAVTPKVPSDPSAFAQDK